MIVGFSTNTPKYVGIINNSNSHIYSYFLSQQPRTTRRNILDTRHLYKCHKTKNTFIFHIEILYTFAKYGFYYIGKSSILVLVEGNNKSY